VEKESEEVGLRRAVKLSGGLRVVVGLGRACADEQELTRAILLEWAKRQGAVVEVDLTSLTARQRRNAVRAIDWMKRNAGIIWNPEESLLSNSGNNKRQRVRGDQKTLEPVDVKLSEELREMMGGRAYADEQGLTRAILLEWAKRQGAVTEVNFVSVTVQSMGGKQVEVNLDDSDSTVKTLKRSIHDKQGVPPFKQQLFLLPKSVDNAEVNAAAIQKPMSEDELILVDCCVALCIDDDALAVWDCSNPSIADKTFALIRQRRRCGLFGTQMRSRPFW
jgi:hypothetical protein